MIRLIEVDQRSVNAREVEVVAGLMRWADESPEQARMLQGCVALGFPGQEEKGEETWEDEAVRAWTRHLHAAVPHLFYYMDPSPELGAVKLFLRAHHGIEAPPGAGEELGFLFPMALRGLAQSLVAASVHAERNAEDGVPIVAALLKPLAPPIVELVGDSVTESLALGGDPTRSRG
jgi:hypothetical protein